jgi:hypothetical protein
VLNLPISGGHLANCSTGKLSEALKPAYEEAASALRQEAVLGSDETGHHHGGERYWTWCLRAARFTVFHIDPTRATQVLLDLLGEDFGGILTVDYYSANRSFARRWDVRTQYCWSHLLRDVLFLRQLGRPPLVRWADQLLAIARGLFRAWHRRTGADPPRWRRQKAPTVSYVLPRRTANRCGRGLLPRVCQDCTAPVRGRGMPPRSVKGRKRLLLRGQSVT